VSDFCRQCSLEVWGKDSRDLAIDYDDSGVSITRVELCEGCGLTIVDREGNCVFSGCSLHGTKAKEETKGENP
jgi:hypothetical protein